MRCIVYIDMNMVRAGVVEHPAQWKHGGYNEIQSPRRKYILIDYQTLMRLTGFEAYEKFQVAHRRWVQAAVDKANLIRESHWTESIAVGSETFVAAVKKQMHHLAKGRIIRSSTEVCELRDPEAYYILAISKLKKTILDRKTHYFGTKVIEYQMVILVRPNAGQI